MSKAYRAITALERIAGFITGFIVVRTFIITTFDCEIGRKYIPYMINGCKIADEQRDYNGENFHFLAEWQSKHILVIFPS